MDQNRSGFALILICMIWNGIEIDMDIGRLCDGISCISAAAVASMKIEMGWMNEATAFRFEYYSIHE